MEMSGGSLAFDFLGSINQKRRVPCELMPGTQSFETRINYFLTSSATAGEYWKVWVIFNLRLLLGTDTRYSAQSTFSIFPGMEEPINCLASFWVRVKKGVPPYPDLIFRKWTSNFKFSRGLWIRGYQSV